MQVLKKKKPTLSAETLKLIDEFTYHGSNIFSTERDANIRLEKALTVTESL